MELIEYIVLGVVQGFTEMLPISSSGHLALLENWWNTSNPLRMAILLHFGSFVAILVAFRHDIGAALRSSTSVIYKSTVFPGKYILSFRKDSRRKIPFLIILSLLCTSIVAFPLKKNC